MADKQIIFISGRHPGHPICGHCHYVRVHARAAVMAGYEPHIICVGRDPGVEAKDYGVVHTTGFGTWRRDGQKWAPFHVRPLTRSVVDVASRNPSVRLLHGFGLWGCVAARAAAELSRSGRRAIPLVSVYNSYTDEHRNHLTILHDFHGPGENLRQRALTAWIERFVWRLERESISGAQLVTFNYQAVHRQLLNIGHRVPRWRLLPYTAELAFVGGGPAPAAPGPKVPVITMVSRHVPKKGIDILLQALARLKKDRIPFNACIVGDGPFRRAHELLAQRLGLADRVRFTGTVPNVVPYLRRSDIFVLPSLREESGSLAVIEALLCGAAVVASAVDGLVEDINDRENGLLVRPGDVADLAAALQALATDTRLLQAIRAGGRRLAATRFSAPGLSAALAQTYAELSDEPA